MVWIFSYQDGNLYCEAVTVAAIAQQVGTPCYVYSRATLTDHYARFAKAFAALDPLICYSIKSSANLAVCRTLAAGNDRYSRGRRAWASVRLRTRAPTAPIGSRPRARRWPDRAFIGDRLREPVRLQAIR